MNKNPFKSKQYATSKIYRVRPQDIDRVAEEKPNVPQGIMTKCSSCGKVIYTKLLINNFKMCDECGYYFKVSAYERIAYVLDDGEIEEFDKQMTTRDPLNFPGYGDKLVKTQTHTGLVDGLVTGKGTIGGSPVCLGVMDAAFFMGSMGTAIGEKLTRLFERATKERLPVIVFTASGGARMQEGIFSLMQMAKVSAAVAKHSEAGLLYITMLTDPTTGGVTASFAMLGDIILAEPGALIGFAGPRVIEQTIGQKLPEGFQRAEFLLEHGFVDRIVPREEQKNTLGSLLKLHQQNPLLEDQALNENKAIEIEFKESDPTASEEIRVDNSNSKDEYVNKKQNRKPENHISPPDNL